MDLLKMSGVKKIKFKAEAFLKTKFDFDRTLLILEWCVYRENILKYGYDPKVPTIVFKNLNFASIFPERLCKLLTLYCIAVFSFFFSH